MHSTTALWFAVWLGVAMAVSDRRLRAPLTLASAGAAAAGAWMVLAGPLAGHLAVMDAAWLETLQAKDYLFPARWPLQVWVLNLAYAPVLLAVYRRRAALGLARDREAGLVAGCLALLVPFACALPLVSAHVALAVQLQTARIFWMLDFLTVVYVVWWLAEGRPVAVRRARARALGRRYGLDYLVTEQVLPLPAVFESGALRVYRLREPGGAMASRR